MQQITLRRSAGLLLLFILLFNGCKNEDTSTPKVLQTEEYSGILATEWFNLSLRLTQNTSGFTPPVAARAFGYTGLTLYEAVVQGTSDYQSLQGQLNGFEVGKVPAVEPGENYHWGMVANAALAQAFRRFYRFAKPANLAAIDSLELVYQKKFDGDLPRTVLDRSINYGRSVAEAVFQFSFSDGQDECSLNNFPSDFTPPVGEGLWVPTAPAFQRALQPRWGEVRPFLVKNIVDAQPAGHPPFSTDKNSLFYEEAVYVYNAVNNRSPEQEIIARFWSDDPGSTSTPPGHSISVASQVLKLENADLALTAETYAKVGMGLHDAFISCWYCKYKFNLMRPITYIRQYIDPNFTPVLNTPPFPEYTSGHSVQSGATAEILTQLFGPAYPITDRTHENRKDINGSPRSFNSFEAMAAEAALSRLYGGIHYQYGIDDGLVQGKRIGQNISLLIFKK